MTLPRQIRRALVAVAAVLATAGFAVATTVAADHRVEIVGLEFVPGEITVAVGDTITWEVTEAIGAPHSVTSGDAGDEDTGAEFDSGPSGLQDEGETFEHTFEAAGTFPYFCLVHGEAMSGVVFVQDAGASPGGSPAASAAASPGTSPSTSAGESPGASPGASPGESPIVGEQPPHEGEGPIPPERKVLAAGILAATIVILFVAAAIWRRMNPA